MSQIEIKILGQVITARYGTLSTGDRIVTDAAYAKHLVEDCSAAEYVTKPAAAAKPAAPSKKAAASKAGAAGAAAPRGDGDTPPAPVSAVAAEADAPPVEAAGDVQTSAQPAAEQ